MQLDRERQLAETKAFILYILTDDAIEALITKALEKSPSGTTKLELLSQSNQWTSTPNNNKVPIGRMAPQVLNPAALMDSEVRARIQELAHEGIRVKIDISNGAGPVQFSVDFKDAGSQQ